jgi:signal transduction histidine kinase
MFMKKEIKVLIIEDAEEDLKLIERALIQAGISDMKNVNTAQEFHDALLCYCPDVILSDHSLPQFNSLSALNVIKKKGLNTPFIIVSGNASEDFANRCLQAGAKDYVLKSNLSRLPSSIEAAISQQEKKIDSMADGGEDQLIKHNKELETFIYHISHNLRSPLMSMLGLVGLIKREQADQTITANYINLLESSIFKLDHTLKELLDYIKNSKDDLIIEHIDIEKLIEDQFDRMKYLPGAESISKQIIVESKVPFYSDHYRLSVVINNLVSNAIKYSDPKKTRSEIKILVRIEQQSAVIVFEDNGIGINPQDLPKVFDMFFRATSSREGAGLGLYIVREAIEKLQGKVSIESVVDEGTVFRIEVPNYSSSQHKQ